MKAKHIGITSKSIQARRVDVERLSAQEFVKLRETNPQAAKGARFEPPALGARNFGSFIVRRRVPSFVPELD